MMTRALNELVENFAFFDDWEERYRYLIDLGRALPVVEDSLKTDKTLVRGCTSRVWIVPEVREGKFFFKADSDAHIVRGLIALLDKAYQGQDVSALGEIDIESAFAQMGLDQNLSPNRRSGFSAMVERIKSFAA